MIRAGSLAYSVFLLFISTVLSFLLFIAFQHLKESYIKYDQQAFLMDNCVSGIQLAMTAEQVLMNEKVEPLSDIDGLLIKKRPWGCFKVVSSSARWGDNVKQKTGLVASEYSELDSLVLWLAPLNYSLRVSGNAKVLGNVRLPKRGAEKGLIGNRRFEGTDLYIGKSLPNFDFPRFPQSFGDYWRRYLSTGTQEDSVIGINDFSDTLKWGFAQKTLNLQTEQGLVLRDCFIKGNVIVKSSKEIVVDSTANLDHVVLIAPVIKILSGAKMRAHLIANDTILIDSGATLAFPSSILLFSKGSQLGCLQILSNSLVEGIILAEGIDDIYRTKQPLIKLNAKARIHGTVYCDGTMELKSLVIGHVISRELILEDSGNHLEGVLLDAQLACRPSTLSMFLPQWLDNGLNQSKDEVVSWLED